MTAAARTSDSCGPSRVHVLNASSLTKIAGLVLATVLIWLLLRAADWRSVVGEIRRSNILLLLCAWIFLGGTSWLLRAVRWRSLLITEKEVGFWPIFWANNAGNLGNVLLPARAGEFIRSAMVGAGSGLTQRFVLATAACERIFDLFVFVTMAEIIVRYSPGIPDAVFQAINFAFLFAVAGIVVLVIAARSEQWIHLVVARYLRRTSLANRAEKYLEPLIAGVRTIYGRKQMIRFIGLSVVIWLVDVSGAKLVAFAMGFALSFRMAFVLTAGLVFINLIPATPGQIGVYQWVVVRVLALSHIEYNRALAYSLVMQASSYFVLALLGVPGLMSYRKLRPRNELPTIGAPEEVKSAPRWLQDPQ